MDDNNHDQPPVGTEQPDTNPPPTTPPGPGWSPYQPAAFVNDQTPQPSSPVTPAYAAPAPPISTPTPPVATAPAGASAGLLVLQWLTYAFWGWTVLTMSILTGAVLANFINSADTSGFTPYGIAAVLVLLPIAIVSDVFFSKHELSKKTGASSVIMVIHAVIFALFGIGSLIAAVFSMLSLFTSSGSSSSTKVALFTSLIVFLLYGLTFLRTINPVRLPAIRRFFPIIMCVSVGIIAVLGFIGPIAHAHATRNDKLIETNLSIVSNAVNGYASHNHKLPNDLNSIDLSTSPDAKRLVSSNLVRYVPNSYTSTTVSNNYSYSATTQSSTAYYYYELCVTYKEASKTPSYYQSYSAGDSSGYGSAVDTYGHAAGPVCYKVKASTTGV